MTKLGTVVLEGNNGIRVDNAPRQALDGRVEDAMHRSGLLVESDGFRVRKKGPFHNEDTITITMMARAGANKAEIIELFAGEVDKIVVMLRDFKWDGGDLVLANAPLEARDVRIEDALNRSGLLVPGGFQVKMTGPSDNPTSVTIIMTPRTGVPTADETTSTDKVRQVPLEYSMAARWLLILEIEKLVAAKVPASS